MIVSLHVASTWPWYAVTCVDGDRGFDDRGFGRVSSYITGAMGKRAVCSSVEFERGGENSCWLDEVDVRVHVGGQAVLRRADSGLSRLGVLPKVEFLEIWSVNTKQKSPTVKRLTVSIMASANDTGTLILTQSFAGVRTNASSRTPWDASH